MLHSCRIPVIFRNSDAEYSLEALQAEVAGVGDDEELDHFPHAHEDKVTPQGIAQSASGNAGNIEERVRNR